MKIVLTSLIILLTVIITVLVTKFNFFTGNQDELRHVVPTMINPAPIVKPTGIDKAIRLPSKSKDDVSQQLFTVAMAFSLPISANIDDDITAQLLIDPTKTVEELENQLSKSGKKITEKIKVSTIVIADIVTTDFEVKNITPTEQAVMNDSMTEWLWILVPKKPGLHSVNLTVTAVVKVGERETKYQIKTFERSIDIEVKPKQLVMNWFSKYWQWLLSTIFIPIIVFFVKRKFFK